MARSNRSIIKQKCGDIMKNAHGNTFIMYWHKNPEWYCINEKLDRFELTDAAPEKARKSFELFERINGLKESENAEGH